MLRFFSYRFEEIITIMMKVICSIILIRLKEIVFGTREFVILLVNIDTILLPSIVLKQSSPVDMQQK